MLSLQRRSIPRAPAADLTIEDCRLTIERQQSAISIQPIKTSWFAEKVTNHQVQWLTADGLVFIHHSSIYNRQLDGLF
jgi:hypothetical protein